MKHFLQILLCLGVLFGQDYDPETGELIKPKKEAGVKYDPSTGLPITGQSFDPETGQIIKPKPDPEPKKDVVEKKPVSQKQNSSPEPTRVNEPSDNGTTRGEIVFQARQAANRQHSRELHTVAGMGSCLIWPIGIPAAYLYASGGVASAMNPYEQYYLNLSEDEKYIYEDAYKAEEKKLRFASIGQGQLGCILMFVLIASS